MTKTSIKRIVETSIVTAFTIAAALIWKDVITEGINLIVPANDVFLYKIIAAFIATCIIVIAIYVILKSEEEATHVLEKFYKRH